MLIATNSLKVGNDFPNVADVVVLNPKDPNDIIQKTRCAGHACGLVISIKDVFTIVRHN